MLAFLGEKLGVPPADGIPTAEYLVRAMRAAARDELQLTRSIEGQWTRDGSVYTLPWHPRGDVPLHVIVELDPVHVFLGPATRLTVTDAAEHMAPTAAVARWNSQRADSPQGLWTPLVTIDGQLAATTLLPANFVGGIASADLVSGWLSNLAHEGLRALQWAADHP
jgi:hypothetical protein